MDQTACFLVNSRRPRREEAAWDAGWWLLNQTRHSLGVHCEAHLLGDAGFKGSPKLSHISYILYISINTTKPELIQT